MVDMSGELKDVTKFVKSDEFKPEYCEGRLVKLIKTKPKQINKLNEDSLQLKLKNWEKEYNEWLLKHDRDTLNIEVKSMWLNTKYQYSYLVIYNKIYDVYRTDTKIEINGNKNFSFFIRLNQDGYFVDDKYNEDGWIINSCGDQKNSRIQNIYEK